MLNTLTHTHTHIHAQTHTHIHSDIRRYECLRLFRINFHWVLSNNLTTFFFQSKHKLIPAYANLSALFNNFLTPELSCQSCNTLDDWLKSTSTTNHQAGYVIHGLTQELKSQ